MNPITLTPDSTNTFYQLAAADFLTLTNQGVLILSANAGGLQIQIIITANLYQPQAQVVALQAEVAADQAVITQDTTAEQSVQSVQSVQSAPANQIKS